MADFRLSVKFHQLRYSAECLQDKSSAQTTRRKHMSCVCYLGSPLALAAAYRKHTSCESYPLLWWCHCTWAEVCLPSCCLEMGCITPLFYCCVLDRVYGAIAWQCIDQICYNIYSPCCHRTWFQIFFFSSGYTTKTPPFLWNSQLLHQLPNIL
jgi:hypothetical protein